MLKILWDDDTVPAMKRERNLPAVLSRDEINAIIDATPNLKQICVAAVFDVVQDGLRCNGSLLVFEELCQRSCGEGRAHIDRTTCLLLVLEEKYTY